MATATFFSGWVGRLRQRWFADRGLTKKAYLNAVAEALDYGARLLVGFFLTPLLVVGLGSYGYGLWQVISRVIGYMTPASSRPSQALKWVIARRQSSDDFAAKRQQVGCALAVWLLFLPLLVGLGAATAWYAPLWLSVPAEAQGGVRWAAGLLVVNLVLLSLIDLPRSALTGENLGYKRMGLSALVVCLGGVFMAAAVTAGGGLAGVAAANLAATVLSGVLFFWVARRFVPWFGIARPSFREARRFLRLSVWFLLWSLVMMTLRASDVLLLGVLASVEEVSRYALSKYVPETLVNLVAILAFGAAPGLGGIIGAGDLARAARVRAELMLLSWLLVTAAGVAILLWNRAFVALWVGPEHYAGAGETLLIVTLVAQFVFIRNDAGIIDLTLNLRRKVLLGALASALAVGTAALLVGGYGLGITGLCLGMIAGRSVLSLAYPWLIGNHLGIAWSAQLRAALRPAAATAALFALALYCAERLRVETWAGLTVAVAATLALALALALTLGASAAQRQRVAQRLGAVVRRL